MKFELDPLGAARRDETQRFYGLAIGIVTDNVCNSNGDSFDKDYRVKLKFPWLPGDDSGFWARICTMGAGPDRGVFWLPEVNDEVCVSFENGDFNRPIVLGSLWNGVDKPTYSNKDAKGKALWAGDPKFSGKHEAKKNDLRSFTSRKFHQLIFNDNADEPRVSLHSSQKHRIVLDDKGGEANKIEIYDGKEENYILIDTKNKKITIETKTGDMLLKASGTITLECDKLETKSKTTTNMKVGTNYKMDAGGTMKHLSSGAGNMEAGGTMTIKGSTVEIN